MNRWEIVALPQGDEIMKNGRIADTAEAERILNNHERLVEALAEVVTCFNCPEWSDRCEEVESKARTLLDELENKQ